MEVLSRTEGQKMSEHRCSLCVAFHGIAETVMRANETSRKPHA